MLDFSGVRVLSLDCYGTLVDWESGILSAMRPLICRNGKPIAELRRAKEEHRDPLRSDPELAGVVFHENPAAPLDPEDWPTP